MKYTVTTQIRQGLPSNHSLQGVTKRTVDAASFSIHEGLTTFCGANERPIAAFSDVISIEPEKEPEAK